MTLDNFEETDIYIQEQATIHCDHCNKRLIDILCTNFKEHPSQHKNKFKITKCAYCGKSSIPTKTFKGNTNIKPCPGIEMRDNDCQEIDGIIITDLETYKK